MSVRNIPFRLDSDISLAAIVDKVENCPREEDFSATYELHAGPLHVRSNVVEPISVFDSQLRFYRSIHPPEEVNNSIVVSLHYLDPADPADRNTWGEVSTAIQDLLQEAGSRVAPANADGLQNVRTADATHLYKPKTLYARFSRAESTMVTICLLGTRHGMPNPHTSVVRKTALDPSYHEFGWELVADIVKSLYAQAHNLFSVHAAMVSLGPKAVLVGGASGSGKTTTALALVRDGFRFHTDDMTFVRGSNASEIRCGGISMPPRIVGRPPADLDALEKTLSKPRSHGKYAFKGEISSYANATLDWQSPCLILLLDRNEKVSEKHRFSRCSSAEALSGVLDQALDPLQATRCEEWMDAALALIGICPVYRVGAGRDLRSLASRVRDLLENE